MGKQLLDQNINDYLLSVSLKETPELKALREKTDTLADAVMMSAPDEAQFLCLLLKLMHAKNIIEVGVFTGYTTLAIAQTLPDDGHIIACDTSEDFTNIGKAAWTNAGVNHKIDLRIAPALDTLQSLLNEGKHNQFDFVFIDADKVNYINYFEACLKLIRPGGIIAIDNVLCAGSDQAYDPNCDTPSANGIRACNEHVYASPDVDISMLSTSQGLTLALKK